MIAQKLQMGECSTFAPLGWLEGIGGHSDLNRDSLANQALLHPVGFGGEFLCGVFYRGRDRATRAGPRRPKSRLEGRGTVGTAPGATAPGVNLQRERTR